MDGRAMGLPPPPVLGAGRKTIPKDVKTVPRLMSGNPPPVKNLAGGLGIGVGHESADADVIALGMGAESDVSPGHGEFENPVGVGLERRVHGGLI
jgi:hypothetical protein